MIIFFVNIFNILENIVNIAILLLLVQGAKSQYPYVGLNSSVTECPIEIFISVVTYFHHWFEEFVKSKNIRVHFFQIKVFDSLDSRIELNFIELCLVIRITFVLTN